MEVPVVTIYPSCPISAHSYFDSLSFPPVFSIGPLVGKSSFQRWRSEIQPVLFSNPYSSRLIVGNWTEPGLLGGSRAGTDEGEEEDLDRRRCEWQTANTATCRFIRATLALNVAPFVRQHKTAKALYLNLVWLYGEDGGIDTQGGPSPSEAGYGKLPKGRASRASLLAALQGDDNAFADVMMAGDVSSPYSPSPSSVGKLSLLPHSEIGLDEFLIDEPVLQAQTLEPSNSLVPPFWYLHRQRHRPRHRCHHHHHHVPTLLSGQKLRAPTWKPSWKSLIPVAEFRLVVRHCPTTPTSDCPETSALSRSRL
jgi:hypothetical protein